MVKNKYDEVTCFHNVGQPAINRIKMLLRDLKQAGSVSIKYIDAMGGPNICCNNVISCTLRLWQICWNTNKFKEANFSACCYLTCFSTCTVTSECLFKKKKIAALPCSWKWLWGNAHVKEAEVLWATKKITALQRKATQQQLWFFNMSGTFYQGRRFFCEYCSWGICFLFTTK